MSKQAMHILIKKMVSLASEAMYKDTEEIGMKAKEILKRAQMNNLQNIAFSSSKVVDIFDYIKGQTGKDSKKEGWAKDDLGPELLQKLKNLENKRKSIIDDLNEQGFTVDDFDRQKIYLDLCREFIKHTVAQYLYGMEVQG